VFKRERREVCHTPPHYTNNKVTLAGLFEPPKTHLAKYDILPTRVGTDSRAAMQPMRGTGYFKVPSLKGVWYRGPFEHNGSVAGLIQRAFGTTTFRLDSKDTELRPAP
jgi:cytochrome c peroxidase